MRRTVNALPILLLLAIENGVFVLGYHFLLDRHLVLPSLDSFRGFSLLRQCLIHNCDDRIDSS